jgi:hypothetical protein
MPRTSRQPWEEVGKILIDLRGKSLSQLDTASFSERFREIGGNFSERTLRRWEKGGAVPSITQLYAITSILRTPQKEIEKTLQNFWNAVRNRTLRQLGSRSVTSQLDGGLSPVKRGERLEAPVGSPDVGSRPSS